MDPLARGDAPGAEGAAVRVQRGRGGVRGGAHRRRRAGGERGVRRAVPRRRRLRHPDAARGRRAARQAGGRGHQEGGVQRGRQDPGHWAGDGRGAGGELAGAEGDQDAGQAQRRRDGHGLQPRRQVPAHHLLGAREQARQGRGGVVGGAGRARAHAVRPQPAAQRARHPVPLRRVRAAGAGGRRRRGVHRPQPGRGGLCGQVGDRGLDGQGQGQGDPRPHQRHGHGP
mmetsp:Transcript_24633/g.60528  ORF Transcript_24633/g.60528 Transcript_24633/m.60528 type:complete len:227 (-) Transcript_24633:373-1053(-)